MVSSDLRSFDIICRPLKFFLLPFSFKKKEMVGPSGLEPPTSRLSVVRSSQLSYGPILDFPLLMFFLKRKNGGDKRDRTVDPLLAKQVLSQLSYTPIFRRPAPSKLNNVSYSALHQTSDLGIKRSCSFLSRTPARDVA